MAEISGYLRRSFRYCECFANGEYCDNCGCDCCYNNEANDKIRNEAVSSILEKNPNAFRTKVRDASH